MLEFHQSQRSRRKPISRRAMLRIGGLAPMGLGLASLLASRESVASSPNVNTENNFGRAKRCLMLFMWGGPAHQDTFDMKPDAPANIRGEFKPIATNVPGVQFCEHLPHMAKHMDKLALVRSVTHRDNNHSTSAHWMLTGHKHRLSAENFGASPDDSPHLGSVVSKLSPVGGSLPTFVGLPERIATTIGAVVPGQTAGWLGKQYDPLTIDQHPDLPDFRVQTLAMSDGMNTVRVRDRANLLESFNQARDDLERAREVHAMSSYYQRAIDLVSSPQARDAFDLASETPAERDRFGRGTFGQSVLLARRLLTAGVKLVTVYWHRDKPGVDTTWDTHANNFKSLKERLLPQVDRPIATLLDDLHQRGMLDDTLVVWSSEFGRTPKINGKAGRDHWGRCNTIWMAGGGIQGGQVYGASDRHAAAPISNPVSPADVSATIFHLLGIRPDSIIHDRQQRPVHISNGQPIGKLFSA